MIPTYRDILAITVLTWRDQLSDSSTITPRKRVSVFLSIGVWEIFNGQGRATISASEPGARGQGSSSLRALSLQVNQVLGDEDLPVCGLYLCK